MAAKRSVVVVVAVADEQRTALARKYARFARCGGTRLMTVINGECLCVSVFVSAVRVRLTVVL